MYKIQEVANWILKNADDVTNKKLQKLVYYAYAWYLVFNNDSPDNLENRLFANHFEAWIHGAVDSELYDMYKIYGSQVIPKYNGKLPLFSADEQDLFQQVITVYGIYNGNQLEAICHKEEPWINARKGCPPYMASNNAISDRDIFICYASRL